jgi:hypothetical protein
MTPPDRRNLDRTSGGALPFAAANFDFGSIVGVKLLFTVLTVERPFFALDFCAKQQKRVEQLLLPRWSVRSS